MGVTQPQGQHEASISVTASRPLTHPSLRPPPSKILKEAADLIPVTYVKGAIGTVVILLETVEKVKQNREDLRELCENTTRIAVYLGEQLASHQNTTAIKLKDMCEELESELQGVIAVITKLQRSRGLGGQVKEFFRARSITDKITGYQRSIQAKCETLKLTSIVDMDFKVASIIVDLSILSRGFFAPMVRGVEFLRQTEILQPRVQSGLEIAATPGELLLFRDKAEQDFRSWAREAVVRERSAAESAAVCTVQRAETRTERLKMHAHMDGVITAIWGSTPRQCIIFLFFFVSQKIKEVLTKVEGRCMSTWCRAHHRRNTINRSCHQKLTN
ncbi:hypothetical protein B0H13DRAFT_1866560 [Mycena leptocephala]|nr:hypothetical protein B0H13DRAFT_1866560 [Mycena leptocephala]